jgi:S1-C subfamily serine protease
VDTVSARGGALIGAVERGGPAANAGLRPADVIVSVAGHRVAGSDSLAQAVAAHKPGQTVAVRVVRRGHQHVVRVTLGARPGRF